MKPRKIKPINMRLAGLRKQSGLSLQAVADRVGCTKSHVWELEKGFAHNPSLQLANRLARLYGVSLDYLANGSMVDWFRENAETMADLVPVMQRGETVITRKEIKAELEKLCSNEQRLRIQLPPGRVELAEPWT